MNEPLAPKVHATVGNQLQPPLWLLAAESPVQPQAFDEFSGNWVRTAEAANIDEADEDTLKQYLYRSRRERHGVYMDRWGEWGIVAKNRIWRQPIGNKYLWWQKNTLVPKASK
jgi:hypothetical protein